MDNPRFVRLYLKIADFPLHDEAAVIKFEKLYQTVLSNTHVWELRGFTPYQYTYETGTPIARFVLPRKEDELESEQSYIDLSDAIHSIADIIKKMSTDYEMTNAPISTLDSV